MCPYTRLNAISQHFHKNIEGKSGLPVGKLRESDNYSRMLFGKPMESYSVNSAAQHTFCKQKLPGLTPSVSS